MRHYHPEAALRAEAEPLPLVGERRQHRGDQRLLEGVALLALVLVVDHHHDRVPRREDRGDEGVGVGERRQGVAPARVVGDAVARVDLAAQELGHLRVEAEALRELDQRQPERQEGQEERVVGAVLLEGAPPLAGPIVLDDRRHLAVVADDDQVAVGPQGQGGHRRLGQVHLRGLVEDQAVGDGVAEELLRPAVLEQPADPRRRRGEDAPALAQDGVGGARLARRAVAVAVEADCAGGRRALPPHAEERDVEQARVEVGVEDCGVRLAQLAQAPLRLGDILEQDVGGRVGLAGEEGAVVEVGGHRALQPREEGEGGRVALAGAGRPLHQQRRRVAARADELALARLEAVQRAGVAQRVEAGEEARLPGGRGGEPADVRAGGAGDAVVERVALAGAEPLGDLLAEVAVPVVRVGVERVALVSDERLVPLPEDVAARIGGVARLGDHHLRPAAHRAPRLVALDHQPRQVDARAVEHLLRRGRERDPLRGGQARVDRRARAEDQPVPLADRGEGQQLVEAAVDPGAVEAQPEAQPRVRAPRLLPLLLRQLGPLRAGVLRPIRGLVMLPQQLLLAIGAVDRRGLGRLVGLDVTHR